MKKSIEKKQVSAKLKALKLAEKELKTIKGGFTLIEFLGRGKGG